MAELLRRDRRGVVLIHTDGVCLNEGRAEAQAGYGVWFASDHPWNISEPVRGPPSLLCAEIEAVTEALKAATKHRIHCLRILLDSKYVHQCLTESIYFWKTNNWQQVDGKPPPCLKQFQDFDRAREKYLTSCTKCNSRSHVDYESERSFASVGNHGASKLATSGALNPRKTS